MSRHEDLAGSLEHAMLACSELSTKSKDADLAIADLKSIEHDLQNTLAHALALRAGVMHDFASLLERASREHQEIEHKTSGSLTKVFGAMAESRTHLAGLLDKLHATHTDVVHWVNEARTELQRAEQALVTNAATLKQISEDVGREYVAVYTAISHEQEELVEGTNQCRAFLSDSVQQIASHCSQLGASIQHSSDVLSNLAEQQAGAFATQLQQLCEHELSSGVSSVMDVAQRGLHDNVKAIVEHAASEVEASVHEAGSRADSHRHGLVDALLPTDGNVKELDDVFKPLGDLVDRVSDLARSIGFLG